ncbi:MAG: MmcQ/YjbR family DNA-binding protein [Alphaproteobacteria bacterium]|nr:MmcQ/YjbR family DNA-binding protein [Alphaproteobacteria bacterium]
MAVTAKRARELALAMPDASDKPHFDRTAFRTPKRTFCTLANDGTDMNFMFDPELRDFYCELSPAFTPVPGGWGRMGATRCDLKAVDLASFRSALAAAHARAMAPAKSARAKNRKS